MSRSRLAAAALLLLPGAAPADPALDAEEVEFVRLINEYRAANGLPCLSVSPTANRAADYMSRAMGEQAFFNHNEPPCSGDTCTGRDPFERMVDFGHDGWRTAAENIAAGAFTAAQAFDGWKHSPGHNRNMLGAHFTAMGIARVVVEGSPMGVYWTNTFSDYVDGTHDCSRGLPPVGYGGGAGGGPGEEPIDCETGAGGDDGWGIGRPRERDPRCDELAGAQEDAPSGGGCASAAGLPLLGLAAVGLLLRRR